MDKRRPEIIPTHPQRTESAQFLVLRMVYLNWEIFLFIIIALQYNPYNYCKKLHFDALLGHFERTTDNFQGVFFVFPFPQMNTAVV